MKPNVFLVAGVLMLFLPGGFTVRDAVIRSDKVPPVPANPITELKRGDLLVRPNHNWWPGTSTVPGGSDFGHAAIVVKGAENTDLLELLSETVIFESQARKVPGEYQLRSVPAYLPGEDFRFANENFSPSHKGNRYLIRPGLGHEAIDSVIAYVLKQDDGLSSWRAMKGHESKEQGAGSRWYCSLLIWQAYHDVLGIDLDGNKGLIFYPNDLINSPFFQDDKTMTVRF